LLHAYRKLPNLADEIGFREQPVIPSRDFLKLTGLNNPKINKNKTLYDKTSHCQRAARHWSANHQAIQLASPDVGNGLFPAGSRLGRCLV
jgi:hypothetical protein